jgi:hypothetical protein
MCLIDRNNYNNYSLIKSQGVVSPRLANGEPKGSHIIFTRCNQNIEFILLKEFNKDWKKLIN